MRRLIDDYKAELRHMMRNNPQVPWLFLAIAAIYLIAAALD